MAKNQACCTLPPCTDKYEPKGKIEQMGDLSVYITGDPASGKAIIVIYDIFGFFPQTQQTLDLLAGQGFYIVMPDFFHGKPWPIDAIPIEFPKLQAHLRQHADYDTNLKPNIQKVYEHLKKQGANKVGILGFCWGVSEAVRAACTDTRPDNVHLDAVAGPHPSFINVNSVEHLQVPLCLLPTKDDPDMSPLIQKMAAKGIDTLHERFDDMHHGFCAARADFKNPENAKRTSEAVALLCSFFKKHL